MATSDEINNLPVNLGSASTGHTATHDVIHQALQELYARPQPEAQDTGLRNISSLMTTHASSSDNPTLERIGHMVRVNYYVRRFDVKAGETGDVLFTLPTGFRPTATYRTSTVQPSGVTLQVSTSGAVSIIIGSIPINSYVTFSFAHLSREEFPTVYPGTPG